MALSPGARLGPYELLELLGTGGMGEVYRARDSKLNRDVAIKILPSAFAEDAERMARFQREAHTLAALNHPAILTIHDQGVQDGVPYLVTELLEGETLREKLGGRALPEKRASEIALQLAQGLAAAHEKGIIHRDLKPENIWITRDGRVKLLDFGLAKANGMGDSRESSTQALGGAPETGTGVVLGTIGYMSPEQVRGDRVDTRTDLFSFGVVFWEMLAGRRPFMGASAVETMNAILKEDPPDLEAGLNVSPALERLLHHCMAKEAAERIHSAHDLALALEGITDAGTPMPLLGTGKTKLHRPLLLGLGLGAALAGLAGMGLWALHWPPFASHAEPTFRRLTFRPGNLLGARFTKDGHMVVYTASWEGRPLETYLLRVDSLESRSLGLPGARLAAVSARGDLAVHQAGGSLARVPLLGGPPRIILDQALHADWSPEGETLAVLRREGERCRLEFPVGRTLYESLHALVWVRVSPTGDRVAVTEFVRPHMSPFNALHIFDRSGRRQTIQMGPGALYEVAWAPDGKALYTSYGPNVRERAIWRVGLDGTKRRLLLPPKGLVLYDVAPDGSLLTEQIFGRFECLLYPGPGKEPLNVSWLDGCRMVGLAAAAKAVVLTDDREGSGPLGGVWLWSSGEQEPVRLGTGDAVGGLSPDGKWIPTLTRAAEPRLVLLPVEAGQPRTFPVAGLSNVQAEFLPDGRALVLLALNAATGQWEIHRAELQDGSVKRIGVLPFAPLPGHPVTLSPWGDAICLAGRDGALWRVSTEVDASVRLPFRVEPGDYPFQWSLDGKALFVVHSRRPAVAYKLDVATGARTPWRDLPLPKEYDTIAVVSVKATRDGEALAYTYNRVLFSDLYLVEGLK